MKPNKVGANSLSISVLQMTSGIDVQQNLATVLKAFEGDSAELMFLPENSLYMNTEKGPIPKSAAFDRESPEIKALQVACRSAKKALHLGGIPWRDQGRVMNAAVIVDPNGDIAEPYFKTHLFDLSLPTLKVMESDSYSGGQHLQVFEYKGWKIATAICYDIRFPELFVHYRQKFGLDVIVVPSAFTQKTGEAHWETLLRARAIENQCFVVAPAQVGGHWSVDGSQERKTWGQSLVIDPWGQTLGEDISHTVYRNLKETTLQPIGCLLEREAIQKVRNSMPMDQHRVFQTCLELRCSLEDT